LLILSVAALCVAESPAPSAAALSRSRERREPTSSSTVAIQGPLLTALEELPDTVPVAIVLPKPGATIGQLQTELAQLEGLFPDLQIDRIAARIERAIGFAPVRLERLTEIGASTTEPALIAIDLAGGPPVFRFGLSDRRRYDAWIDRHSEHGPKLQIGADRASILFPESEAPLACVVRQRTGYCQIGVSSGRDPIAELRRFLEAPGRRMSQLAGITVAADRLRSGADAYVFVRPEAIGDLVARHMIARAAHRHRFDGPSVRRAAVGEVEREAHLLRSRIRSIEGIAMAIDLSSSHLFAELEVVVNRRAIELLRGLIREGSTDEATLRWFETPALARIALRLRPEIAGDLLARAGIKLPIALLSGDVAALALGVDTECPAAKRGAPEDPAALPFLFPTAVAVRLTHQAGESERRAIAQTLGGGDARSELLRHGQAFGSPFEVRMVDEAVLIGTGPGAGAAAVRRWSGASKKQRINRRAFAELAVDLAAVDAALSAGSFGAETRDELRALDVYWRSIRPIVSRFERLDLAAWSESGSGRLRFELELR
jgi:hypothetical protein